jgi:adenosylcobinamide-GDP ribazoletransferase
VADGRLRGGLRLALTTFTVVPLRAGRVDRTTAGVAMAAAPAVGAFLGTLLGTVVWISLWANMPALVAGGLAVALGALLTRGLHLDGLADTADGLGSFRAGPAALEVMKRPDVGPFGVVALAVVLVLQAASFAGAARPVLAGAVALAAGRLAATWACRRGVPAARPDGLGALVAGTVGVAVLVVATIAVGALAAFAVPGRWWEGPVAVAVGLALALSLVRHAVRRLGGVTGDVLGAAIELATTVTLVALTVGP